jgi:hypothetical protein
MTPPKTSIPPGIGTVSVIRLMRAELAGADAPPEAFGPRPASEHLGPPIARPRG